MKQYDLCFFNITMAAYGVWTMKAETNNNAISVVQVNMMIAWARVVIIAMMISGQIQVKFESRASRFADGSTVGFLEDQECLLDLGLKQVSEWGFHLLKHVILEMVFRHRGRGVEYAVLYTSVQEKLELKIEFHQSLCQQC